VRNYRIKGGFNVQTLKKEVSIDLTPQTRVLIMELTQSLETSEKPSPSKLKVSEVTKKLDLQFSKQENQDDQSNLTDDSETEQNLASQPDTGPDELQKSPNTP
jgi:hypothetical protein